MPSIRKINLGSRNSSVIYTSLSPSLSCSHSFDVNSRPKNLEEVSAQDHTTTVLKKTLTSSNVSHSLFRT